MAFVLILSELSNSSIEMSGCMASGLASEDTRRSPEPGRMHYSDGRKQVKTNGHNEIRGSSAKKKELFHSERNTSLK